MSLSAFPHNFLAPINFPADFLGLQTLTIQALRSASQLNSMAFALLPSLERKKKLVRFALTGTSTLLDCFWTWLAVPVLDRSLYQSLNPCGKEKCLITWRKILLKRDFLVLVFANFQSFG